MNLKVKFEICNYRNSGTHPSYGFVIITAAQLSSEESQRFELRDDQGRPAGTLIFESIRLLRKPSFVEYLRSGWFINMSVAIDFTASNGDIYMPNSLHRLN